MKNFWFWVFLYAMRKIGYRHMGSCGNQSSYDLRGSKNGILVDVVFVDSKKEGGHSREVIYEMLKAVREQEHRDDWKCPEPVLDGRIPAFHKIA